MLAGTRTWCERAGTMMRPLTLLVPLIATAAPAAETPRTIGIGSFNRVRIEGAYRVAITTGGSPNARVEGESDDGGAGVDLRVDGDTLVIRRTSLDRWGERGGGAAVSGPVTITLTTPSLSTASVAGGAEVSVTRMTGPRVVLALGGAGSLVVQRIDADQLNAQLVGDGHMTLAGRVATARLVASGAGGIAADALDAGDLTAALQGQGSITARARYTAQVSSSGLGTVAVAGKPKCRMIGQPSGNVRCGTGE